MATEYKIENRNLYIYLDGELDHHMAKKIKHQCDIILNSGIWVILGRYRQVQAMGGTVRLSHMSSSVQKIIHMAGLHQLVEEI